MNRNKVFCRNVVAVTIDIGAVSSCSPDKRKPPGLRIFEHRALTSANTSTSPVEKLCILALLLAIAANSRASLITLSLSKHDFTPGGGGGGGGNWEFGWYTNNCTNSFIKNVIFYLRPML